MPIELQIIRACDFIRLGAQGRFDFASSKLALAELANACHKRGLDQALLDLRALKPAPIRSSRPLTSHLSSIPSMKWVSPKNTGSRSFTAPIHITAPDCLHSSAGCVAGTSRPSIILRKHSCGWPAVRPDQPDVHPAVMEPVPMKIQERPARVRKGPNGR